MKHHGDITKIIDTTGIIIVKYIYDAWGNILDIDDTSGKNIGTINPQIGRFINSDGLPVEQSNILGHNMYAYTQNNPVVGWL